MDENEMLGMLLHGSSMEAVVTEAGLGGGDVGRTVVKLMRAARMQALSEAAHAAQEGVQKLSRML